MLKVVFISDEYNLSMIPAIADAPSSAFYKAAGCYLESDKYDKSSFMMVTDGASLAAAPATNDSGC